MLAGEVCPVFFGAPLKIHWGLSDPSNVVDPVEKSKHFFKTASIIKSNLEKLKNLLDNHSKDDLLSLKVKSNPFMVSKNLKLILSELLEQLFYCL